MIYISIFVSMVVLVSTCSFFYVVGNRQLKENIDDVLDALSGHSNSIDLQINTLSKNVELLCIEVSLLKTENKELQIQIQSLADTVKLITEKCTRLKENAR